MNEGQLYYPTKRRGAKHGQGRRIAITSSLTPADFAVFAKYQTESRRSVSEIVECAVKEYMARVVSTGSSSN